MPAPAQVWRGCIIPQELLYDVARHVWVRLEGPDVVLGMTDVAQTLGGRLVAVTWMRPGKLLVPGSPIAAVESAKWVGPFPTPLTGELLEVNRLAFDHDIAVANRDPYGEGWMARLRPSRFEDERPGLLDGAGAFAAYRGLIEERNLTCVRCVQ